MSAQSWCQALNAPGRTILFAACDSPESLAAFAWSRANLLRQQDTLVLVHAYEKDRVFGGFNCLEEGKRVVAKFENLCRERDVSFRVVLAQGCPVKVITAAALGNKCDLCVMGSRGLSAVKRALYGSVSSRVTSSCPCPVMVIKRPRDEVGAFLTVLPRRVFIRIDGSSQARESFDWAMNCLLSPEIDEVFLMLSSKQKKKGWLGFTGGQRVSQEDIEDEREKIRNMANRCEEECIRKGLNATKMEVTSLDDMLRQAEECSCDLLVVGKDPPRSQKDDTALYAAHYASFPVIAIGDTTDFQHRAAMQAIESARPTTASQRSSTARGNSLTSCPAAARPNTAIAGRAGANYHSPRKTADDDADKKKEAPTLGPRSSSLERLLGTLENTDDSLVCCSRRAQLDDRREEEEMRLQSRRPTAVPEDGVSMNETPSARMESGGGMRRVATKAAIKQISPAAGPGDKAAASVRVSQPVSTDVGVQREIRSRIDTREPWMCEPGCGQPVTMMAS